MRSNGMASCAGVLVYALVMAGCNSSEDGEPGGTSGSFTGGGSGGGNPAAGAGGVSGVGGSSGVGAAGGTSGMAAGIGGVSGGPAGMGGDGASGASAGGTGGAGPVACDPATDIRTGMECAEEADGWFAIKNVVDVWWRGTDVRDPGRGNIDIYLLGKVEACTDGSISSATMRPCGVVLPPFTSDVTCEAFQTEFPNEMWDSPSMPRFTTTGSFTGFTAGSSVNFAAAVGLIGIDLTDGMEDVPTAFPTPTDVGTFACEAGTGIDCFPDADGDGHPGITIRLRSDQATYVSPYQDGKTSGGTEYKYRGAPTGVDLGALCGFGGGTRATQVRIGLRTRIGAAAVLGSDCASGVGDGAADMLNPRAWECAVDPNSLAAEDERVTSMNYACTSAESMFVDENVPAYLALAKGETPPSDTNPPQGWINVARDIPRDPSPGARSAIVRIGGLADAEPTCDMVRSAAFSAL